MEQIIPYSSVLKPYARRLRKDMTECERILWNKIRKRQIVGVQFFRQKPIGSFILDFYSKIPKLAIELDGGQHFIERNKRNDRNRDAYLAELGIHTLRFTNIEVLKNCESVVSKIKQTLLELTNT